MRILFVVDSLDYGGVGRQLTLLIPQLIGKRIETHLCVLGHETPWTRLLSSQGVDVTALHWTRVLDGRPLWRLRQIVRELKPDLVHVLGQAAFRAVMLATESKGLVVSHPNVNDCGRSALHNVDRWLLDRAEKVVACGRADVDFYRRLGVVERKIGLIPPAVGQVSNCAVELPAIRESLGLPCTARLVACVGPLKPHKGFKDAVWALDILKYVHDDLYLLFVGDGPARAELQRFARSIRADDRIRWLGDQSAVPELLTQVDIVWVPSHAERGRNAALEAMAAGRPVIASNRSGLAEIVVEGHTGFLVTCEDKAALARRTHLLLQDEPLRRDLGDAGRQRAVRCFSVENLVDAYRRLYEEAA
jgi:glycosyltransferase involved in cell wall biosynthesis